MVRMAVEIGIVSNCGLNARGLAWNKVGTEKLLEGLAGEVSFVLQGWRLRPSMYKVVNAQLCMQIEDLSYVCHLMYVKI